MKVSSSKGQVLGSINTDNRYVKLHLILSIYFINLMLHRKFDFFFHSMVLGKLEGFLYRLQGIWVHNMFL